MLIISKSSSVYSHSLSPILNETPQIPLDMGSDYVYDQDIVNLKSDYDQSLLITLTSNSIYLWSSKVFNPNPNPHFLLLTLME